MFSIEAYTEELLKLLKDIFGERLVYLGLQGSYFRNEQHENSDIDIMTVIDGITVSDLDHYKNALVKMGFYEKACGFICGKDELAAWNPLEICQLLHTTKDLYGSLLEHVPHYTVEDERNYIKLSIGNLYHELCHRYVHTSLDNSKAKLPAVLKPFFFILQNLYFVENGIFYNSQAELLEHAEGQDKEVFVLLLNMQKDCGFDFDYAFNLLLSWCRNALTRLRAIV